jgi:hypothetical protein
MNESHATYVAYVPYPQPQLASSRDTYVTPYLYSRPDQYSYTPNGKRNHVMFRSAERKTQHFP